MAKPSAQTHSNILSAFAGAGGVVVCGMILSTLGEAVVRRDIAMLDLIPTIAVVGGLLALIPLTLAAIIYLLAKGLNLITAPTALITGLLFGAFFGFLIGDPPLTIWSGCLVGAAAALVWWKLYSRVPSALAPSDTR